MGLLTKLEFGIFRSCYAIQQHNDTKPDTDLKPWVTRVPKSSMLWSLLVMGSLDCVDHGEELVVDKIQIHFTMILLHCGLLIARINSGIKDLAVGRVVLWYRWVLMHFAVLGIDINSQPDNFPLVDARRKVEIFPTCTIMMSTGGTNGNHGLSRIRDSLIWYLWFLGNWRGNPRSWLRRVSMRGTSAAD
jgi:hypothetical protein